MNQHTVNNPTKVQRHQAVSNFDARNALSPHSISDLIALHPQLGAQRMGLAIELLVSILRTAGALRSAQEPVLRKHNLVSAGWRVMGALFFHPEHTMPQHELSAMLGVTRPHVTGVIDALEQDGLVERVPHPEDRRVTLARLTELGLERVEAFSPEYNTVIVEMFKPLSDAEMEQMLNLLFQLRLHVATSGESAPLPSEQ